MKLLIAEDSVRLRHSLNEGLTRSGYAVDLVADGASALRFALSTDYDAIVLDLMLPELDGLTVLRQLRAAGRKTNVLILSAKDQAQDRVRGLDLGADDYLIKPFDFDELLARIGALVRRRYDQRNPVIHLGAVDLDLALHQARCGGIKIALSPSETSLLEVLALNRGRVVSVEHLEDHLYGSDRDVSHNALEVQISSLRKKLRAAGAPDLVQTRRGFGYFIDAS